jgi:hypothetical protein
LHFVKPNVQVGKIGARGWPIWEDRSFDNTIRQREKTADRWLLKIRWPPAAVGFYPLAIFCSTNKQLLFF